MTAAISPIDRRHKNGATSASPLGVLGAAAVVAALPLALVLSPVLGDPERTLHFLLGAAFIVVAVAIFDFSTTPWVSRVGSLGIGLLGAIFALQGVSDLLDSPGLRHVAYDILGQAPERVLPDLFIVWCAVALVQWSRGKTRVFGAVVLVLIVSLEVFDYGASLLGRDTPGLLKTLYLLPFVWLALESRAQRAPWASTAAGVSAASAARSRTRTWLKRGALGLVGIALVVPLFGGAFQAIAGEVDQRRYPAPGRLVDVGGFRMHIHCTGERVEGTPTVILEGALGATSSAWAWIQPEVAATTRVCSYDRAGHGWSDPGAAPRDSASISAELHELLRHAGEPGPYVLAGWSFGGLYIRDYADRYREDVVGLVLIDASSPEQCSSTSAGRSQCASMGRMYAVAPALVRLGVMRVIGLRQASSGLPARQHAELIAASSATKDWDAQVAEFEASPTEQHEAFHTTPLGAMPLVVLTATDHGTPDDLEELWQAWQSGFAALSTNSTQQVVSGANHMSLVFDSGDAAFTSEAIREVLDAARKGIPLPQ